MVEKQFISDDALAGGCRHWLVWEAEQPQAQRSQSVFVRSAAGGAACHAGAMSAQQQQITSEWASSVFSQIAAFEKMGLTDIRQLFLQRPANSLPT
ncbi:hypothetical protein CWS02_00600 [Enterobacter sp. EA-1]|nr:hypothetical protein CWS02_00600 [Enterobacter sp. EA-1]